MRAATKPRKALELKAERKTTGETRAQQDNRRRKEAEERKRKEKSS